MSDTGYDFEDFDGVEDNSPGGLRAALKKAQAQAKKERELREAAEAKASRLEKKSSLTEVLREKSLDKGLARFLEADNVEATPEAVDAWLKENPFFNAKAEAQPEAAAEPTQEGQEAPEQAAPAQNLPPELVAALQASQQLDASGVSPSEVGVLQRIQSISADPSKVSWDQLVEELKGTGAPMA